MCSLHHLKMMVLIVGVLAVGLGLYVGFQTQEVDAHSENDPPTHLHYELLEEKWGFCGASYLTWPCGEWMCREACFGVYYQKVRYKQHGVDSTSCPACGQDVSTRKEHWVDHMYGKCGYWSCLYSSCPSHSGNYDDN